MKKGKKFIALFFILSLIEINCATLQSLSQKRESRRKKQGANLIIQKINGQQVSGELITAKQDSLLLLDTEGKDVSIDIADIKVIRIVKKSQFWVGATFGSLTGGGIGAIVGALIEKPAPIILSSLAAEKKTILGGIFFGFIIGAVGGGLIGASEGTDKTIQLIGMTDSEIQEVLDKLRKKARIRDYK